MEVLSKRSLTILQGIGMTDDIDAIRAAIESETQTKVKGVISGDYLVDLYAALFGEDEVRVDQVKGPDTIVQQKAVDINVHTGRRRRLNIKHDRSYIIPILSHFSAYDRLSVVGLKIGVAVKYVNGGFVSNLINYNQLVYDDGLIYGNVYFNSVRTEEDYDAMEIDSECNWVNRMAVVRAVEMNRMLAWMGQRNIRYLEKLNNKENRRRLANRGRLVEKFS